MEKGRELHVDQSLASIDFADIEPPLLPRQTIPAEAGTIRPLVKNDLFEVNFREMAAGDALPLFGGRMEIIGVTEGALRIQTGGEIVNLSAGHFCLVPADCPPGSAHAAGPVSFLEIF